MWWFGHLPVADLDVEVLSSWISVGSLRGDDIVFGGD